MNSVSSSEDIKPPVGLNGMMKVPAQSSGTPLSLTKHICAICGDRSSGRYTKRHKNKWLNTEKFVLHVLPSLMDMLSSQVNTTASTAVRAARGSLREPYGRT